MKTEGFGLLTELGGIIEDLEKKVEARDELLIKLKEHIAKRVDLYSNFNKVSMYANDQADQLANNSTLIEFYKIQKILRNV